MNVTCDCGHTFKLIVSYIETEEDSIGRDELKAVWVKCPQCNREVDIYAAYLEPEVVP